MGKKQAAADAASEQTVLKTVYDDPLSFSDYTSAIGTHAIFLAFAAVALPRTTLIFQDLPPQKSSSDRPQWDILAPITAWPTLSTWWICAGAAILQASWAGRAVSWIKADQKKRSGSSTEDFSIQTIGDSFGQNLSSWGATLLAALVIHLIVVVLGAPFTTHIPNTLGLSFLLSLLSVYPAFRTLGVPAIIAKSAAPSTLRSRYYRIFTLMRCGSRAERALLYPALGAILGSWCGAYPLALDWDRPWQAYPLPPVFGAIAGYIIGSGIGLFVSVVIWLGSTDIADKKVV